MKNSDFPMKQFLQDLKTAVTMDSGTADVEGCREIARFFKARMEAAGLLTHTVFSASDDHPVVVGITPDSIPQPAGCKPHNFLLVGHMDTVYPRGTAAKRPFRLEDGEENVISTDNLTADGLTPGGIRPVRAFGPGTVDMKAGALLMIYIAEYLTKHHPDIRLCLLLNSDEETGSTESLETLQHWGRHAEAAFVFEGGRKADQFVSTRKGCNKYEISVTGVAAHAGTAPWNGANAIVEMGHLVTALDKLKNYSRGTSVNIGLIQGGSALNVVPDSCTAQMEIRYTDKKEMDRVQRAIERLENGFPKVEGTQVEIRLLASTPPLRETAATQKLMERMKAYSPQHLEELQKLADGGLLSAEYSAYPVDFVAAGGLSDANRLAACLVPVIDGCGPGGGFPHSEKEFLSLETLVKRYVFFTGFLPWLIQNR